MEILMTILPFVPAVIIAIALIALLASGYVKAPPDVAYIISGLHKKPRILVGKAGIKIPFLERMDKLRLLRPVVKLRLPRFRLRLRQKPKVL